jgi:hypothetical protein
MARRTQSDNPLHTKLRTRGHWRRTKSLRFGEGRAALALMKNGEVLRREFIRGHERWSLSGGLKLSPFVVRRLLSNPLVTAVGDGLLAGATQNFVHAQREKREKREGDNK